MQKHYHTISGYSSTTLRYQPLHHLQPAPRNSGEGKLNQQKGHIPKHDPG